MFKRRKKSLWLVMLVLLLALAACGKKDVPSTTEPTPNTPPDSTPSEKILVYVTSADAPTLDPHGQNDTATTTATSQIYDRLVEYAPDGSVVPALAVSYEAKDDYTWEFKLREGVKFHDGSDFTAEAVKINIERILDPEFASPRAVILNVISEVIVVDELTVQIKTENPFGPLPQHLAHNAGSIIAPSAIEEERSGGKKVDENPVGTGPFKFESWARGTELKMVRNDNYWGTKTELDGLVFKVIPEQATRVAMLEKGEGNVILVGSSDVSYVEGLSQVTLDRVSGTRMDYLGFNMNKAPFDNIKVRQAISSAINKQDIVDGILMGQGLPAKTPLAPTVVGNYQDVNDHSYDVEAAKALLTEAGFPDGFKTTLYVNEGSKERADIAELVQANLAEIGIEVDIQIIEWATFLEKTGSGEHELFILGWTTVTADADYGLYALFHSSQHGSPGNRSFYTNPKVDELLDTGRSTTDLTKRLEVYKELTEILVDELPMVYLQHPDFVHGTNGVSSGLFVNFSGTPFFKDVKLAN